jgi:hypothetical protein
MQIIQELMSPQKVFKMNEDGTETVEYRPPTSLQLRAARQIQQLVEVIRGLETALNQAKKEDVQ